MGIIDNTIYHVWHIHIIGRDSLKEIFCVLGKGIYYPFSIFVLFHVIFLLLFYLSFLGPHVLYNNLEDPFAERTGLGFLYNIMITLDHFLMQLKQKT